MQMKEEDVPGTVSDLRCMYSIPRTSLALKILLVLVLVLVLILV